MLVILKLQSASRNLFLWFSSSPLLCPLSPVGLHLFQPFTQISIFIFSHFHAYNTFHFLSPPLFLLLLTPWRRALCSAPPPFTHVTTQPDMTAPLLHPGLSSNEPALTRPTLRDALRLWSFVAVIQATALLHRMVRSCREQSIGINLE